MVPMRFSQMAMLNVQQPAAVPISVYRLTAFIAALILGTFTSTRAVAEDWGAYAIVPSCAPALVLEAVDAGSSDGTLVSINKPSGGANQKWIITPREETFFSIAPAHDPSLVLAAAKGGAKRGAAIVLEKDSEQPWQRWTLTKLENGNYTLRPKHAPKFGLDHLGGKPYPGAKFDLWFCDPSDRHLQWLIKPLAGTGAAAAPAVDDAKTYEPPTIDRRTSCPAASNSSRSRRARYSPAPCAR